MDNESYVFIDVACDWHYYVEIKKPFNLFTNLGFRLAYYLTSCFPPENNEELKRWYEDDFDEKMLFNKFINYLCAVFYDNSY